MNDKFQQIKGYIGHELVRLYFGKCRKTEFDLVGEELPLYLDEKEQTNPKLRSLQSARIDLVLRNKQKNEFVPVEIKFQEANIGSYGVAIEHILNSHKNRRVVKVAISDDKDDKVVRLSRPWLVLWQRPSKALIQKSKDYNWYEAPIGFNEIWNTLNEKLPKGRLEDELIGIVEKNLRLFFQEKTESISKDWKIRQLFD